jgi:hypothetical protein
MFDNFDEFMENRIMKTSVLIQELNRDLANNNAELISLLLHSLTFECPLLLKMIWHNLREYTLSSTHYNTLCSTMLDLQGYIVDKLDDDHNKDRTIETIDKDLYSDHYNKIADLTVDELNELRKNPNINATDAMRLDKYYFENLTVRELDINERSTLFYDYYQTSHNKEKLYNIRTEKQTETYTELIIKDHNKSDELISKMKMNSIKLKHIRHLNDILGLNHSCDNDKIIEKTLIYEKVIPYFLDNIQELKCVFNSKSNIKTNNDMFNTLALIKKIYNNWSGLNLKMLRSKKNSHGKQEATAFITNCLDFYESIKILDSIDPSLLMVCDEE